MSVNIQIIEGFLGQDPDYKVVGDTTVCKISVATSERWKDKKGEKQEKTEWHEVNFWGKDADNINKFFKKGSAIFVMGRTETRTYEDKEGIKRYRTSVRADKWSYPSCRGSKEGDSPGREEGPSAPSSGDDIPF